MKTQPCFCTFLHWYTLWFLIIADMFSIITNIVNVFFKSYLYNESNLTYENRTFPPRMTVMRSNSTMRVLSLAAKSARRRSAFTLVENPQDTKWLRAEFHWNRTSLIHALLSPRLAIIHDVWMACRNTATTVIIVFIVFLQMWATLRAKIDSVSFATNMTWHEQRLRWGREGSLRWHWVKRHWVADVN